MYRLNQLYRNVLITADEVIYHAPTKQTVDPRMIEHSIIVAEERFIRPALGDALYTQIATQKNTLVTSLNQSSLQSYYGDSKTIEVGDIINAYEFLSPANLLLWKEQLWKLCAESVMLLAMPEGFVQFSSEGAIHNAPIAGPMGSNGATTPDIKAMRWAMDKKLQDRIDPLTRGLTSWICNQKAIAKTGGVTDPYPLYTAKCACDESTVVGRKTDLIFLYDDEPNCKCDAAWTL